MSWVIEAFGAWYPVVYPHRDAAEAVRLVRTLEAAVRLEGRQLLDVGCGAGRHLAEFRRAGAHPTGLDLSEALLAEARSFRDESGGDWPLLRGDMRALPVESAAFDGVTSLFTSFGYFSAERDRQVAGEWARVLRPGGFHVLDFLNRERVLAHPNPESERVSAGWRIREERRIEDGPSPRVVKRVRVEPASGGAAVADYEERVALYGLEDLRGVLASAGLRSRDPWGDYGGESFDPAESPRLILVSTRGDG